MTTRNYVAGPTVTTLEDLRPAVHVDDKYRLQAGSVFATGIQTLVRIPLEQARRDRAAGLRIGTLISGYPGSPLGGYDLELARNAALLAEHDVVHVPGINEEIAAGTVWGSQMLDLFPHGRFDGVTGLWYGKSPGVDRAGDLFRHGNLAGGPRNSAAVALVGDDPSAKSSSIPNASELTLASFGMPVVYPGSVQEIFDLGLLSIAMARATGVWVALKLVTNLCDGGATIEVGPHRGLPISVPSTDGQPFQKPTEFALAPPASLELERHLFDLRLAAVQSFAYANGFDEVTTPGSRDRLGIVAAGKTFYDTRQALADLGLDDGALRRLGVRLLRLGLVHPVAPATVREFAEGLERVVVIEEKREFIETQVRAILYDLPGRPEVIGKLGRGDGLARHGELDSDMVADWLVRHLNLDGDDADRAEAYLGRVRRARARAELTISDSVSRPPNYCSGCPHNRSTIRVDGEFIGGGIGCHSMALFMTQPERQASWNTPMGAEGSQWLGVRHFVDLDHIVQNVGDGTFFHSGSQAVRAACASGAPITYKLLYNDAVAMTGGQNPAGAKDLPALTRLLEAEGVKQTIVVSEDVSARRAAKGYASNVTIVDRAGYDDAVRTLARVHGPTVLVYDQQCAAEKRRLRKRGKLPTPSKRVVIDERVCEGCGDCGARSNCMSVVPVDTPYGRKTQIHQSSCNLDYSCMEGDCPSFVTVYVPEGGARHESGRAPIGVDDLPDPDLPSLVQPCRVYILGIGGTGVVTLNQIIAYAAMIDGHRVTSLDQTGLAQKGGAVLSNVTIFDAEEAPGSSRVGVGQADLVLLLDVVAAGNAANLSRCDEHRTVVVGSLDREATALEIRDVFASAPTTDRLLANIDRVTRRDHNLWVPARSTAEAIFGDHMATNLVILGAAYQAGHLPVSARAIEEAIGLNGVAVEQNVEAFRMGRLLAHDPASVEIQHPPVDDRSAAESSTGPAASLVTEAAGELPGDLADAVAAFATELIAYQGNSYAKRYVHAVARVHRDLTGKPGADELISVVARNLFKLMAYKDEYEVARLLVQGDGAGRAAEQFGPGVRVAYNLHPPVLRSLGRKSKIEMGARWAKPILHTLARLRFLRQTPFDPFGRTEVRRVERELIDWYLSSVDAAISRLDLDTLPAALEVANAPDHIRGYEQLKLDRVADARALVERVLTEMNLNKSEVP